MHLYKAEIWQSASGHWYVNDTNDLVGKAGMWYAPARLLDMKLEDYLAMLINEYSAKIKLGKFPIVYWDNYANANRYKLWINRQSRKGKWEIE